MALGGGTFSSMNNVIPGAYINTVSAAKTMSSIGQRGVVAIGVEWDFANQGEIIEIDSTDFRQDSLIILGYRMHDDKLKGLRELFENSTKVIFCGLNKSTKATNVYATAKKGGERGNDILIKVQNVVDEPTKKEVTTMFDYIVIDKQTVKTAAELKDNALVEFKKEGELEPTAGTKLSGGTNGEVTNKEHVEFLQKLEAYSFNALACMAVSKDLQKLYIEFTKRMREEIGLKFGTIFSEVESLGEDDIYDYEGLVVVKNKVRGENVKGNELVPFTAAIYASVPLGKSNLNREYTGDYDIISEFTQTELKGIIKNGRFAYHKVGDRYRVLDDINSLVKTNEAKNIEFKDNQVVRVVDSLAMSDANVFNQYYLGKVNIDKAGIESYEQKVIAVRDEYVQIGALREFDRDGVKVERVEGVRGAVKVNSVVTPSECFRQLYLTNYVK